MRDPDETNLHRKAHNIQSLNSLWSGILRVLKFSDIYVVLTKTAFLAEKKNIKDNLWYSAISETFVD